METTQVMLLIVIILAVTLFQPPNQGGATA
jgi:hypothetical protein